MFFKNYTLQFKIFLVFIFFLLVEGFFYYYSHKLSNFNELFNPQKTGFNPVIWNENGLIENIQVFLLFSTIVIFLKIIKSIKSKNIPKFLYFSTYIYLFSISYYFFEEISWGQHIFKWDTNEFFMTYNNQKETNIHNISNLFDQLPRSFLTIWCCFSFFIFKFLRNTLINENYSKFIFPKKGLIYISAILIIFFLPDFLIDKLGLHPGYSFNSNSIITSELLDFVSFNFIKLSEFHELLFCIYLFYHAVFLRKYILLKT